MLYANKALKTLQTAKKEALLNIYQLQAVCLYKSGHPYQAIQLFQKIITICREKGYENAVVDKLRYVGDMYFTEKNYKKAEYCFKESLALSLKLEYADGIITASESLSLVDSALGNFKHAFQMHKLFKQYNDSVYSQEAAKKTTQLQMQFEFGQKEDSMKLQQLIANNQVKNIHKQNKQQWLILWLSVGIGLVILAGIAFFYINRTKLQRLQLAAQLEKQTAAQQLKEAEFEHKLGDITLSALRSQMNPHFIFNCLNSIKLYAAQNNAKAASDYLTKFSRLIRQMLENSRSERISLKAEMQALELYIQMEAMRFKEKLQYHIVMADNLDAEYIEVPPLLIQPYVENAIWHGLMQKEEGGRIDIQLCRNESDDMLRVTVMDNGIGRIKAMELKSKSATKRKSYGMKVTSERIALINQLFHSNTTVEIIDLYDEAGEAAGTKVVIQIPI